jgi:hypothetical protein
MYQSIPSELCNGATRPPFTARNSFAQRFTSRTGIPDGLLCSTEDKRLPALIMIERYASDRSVSARLGW